MNIQIFGTNKCFDTKKAQRYFKERKIRFQFIDLREKELSRGELQSVLRAVGGDIETLLNEKDPDYAMVHYLTDDAKIEQVLIDPSYLKTPIVRNGKLATVGYQPEVWKQWQESDG